MEAMMQSEPIVKKNSFLNLEEKKIEQKYNVLLVDDDERILHFLKTKLKNNGYAILLAKDGIEALKQIREHDPDLVVLDLMMPKLNGFQTLKEMRLFSSVPVIILSAADDDEIRIKGLEYGADDYLPKPFNPNELLARIEAKKRRLMTVERKKVPAEINSFGLRINFEEHQVTVNKKAVKLTKIEWLLLTELARNADHLTLSYDLLVRIWGPEYGNDFHVLRTWINRLRKKIEEIPSEPRIITVVPKAGYRFNKEHF